MASLNDLKKKLQDIFDTSAEYASRLYRTPQALANPSVQRYIADRYGLNPVKNTQQFIDNKRDLTGEVGQLSNEANRYLSNQPIVNLPQPLQTTLKPFNPLGIQITPRRIANTGLGIVRTGAVGVTGARDLVQGAEQLGQGAYERNPKKMLGGALKEVGGGLQGAYASFRTTPFGMVTSPAENLGFEVLKNAREGKPFKKLDYNGLANDLFISDALGIRKDHPLFGMALDLATNFLLGKGEDAIGKALSNGSLSRAFANASDSTSIPEFRQKFLDNLNNVFSDQSGKLDLNAPIGGKSVSPEIQNLNDQIDALKGQLNDAKPSERSDIQRSIDDLQNAIDELNNNAPTLNPDRIKSLQDEYAKNYLANTVGKDIQGADLTDLRAYEKALAEGDMQTVNDLAGKYPQDARFQTYKTLSESGFINPSATVTNKIYTREGFINPNANIGGENIPSYSDASKIIHTNGGLARVGTDSMPLAGTNRYAADELGQSLGLNPKYLYEQSMKNNVNLNDYLREFDASNKSESGAFANKLMSALSGDQQSGFLDLNAPIGGNKPPEIPTPPDNANNIVPSNVKERGFVTSVQEAQNVPSETKSLVSGTYDVKHNAQLMGEAQALLNDNATIDFRNVKDLDAKIAATIQEAVNLDQAGDHEAAANLYNNLSAHATELGRGVKAFDLLDQMSPQAISLSAAGQIRKYNLTHGNKLPELTGEQEQLISDAVSQIDAMQAGRDKNIAIFKLKNMVDDFIPSSKTDKLITVWKAGLLTSLRTHERNLLGNTINQAAEIAKDPFATIADKAMALKTGKRTQTTTLQGLGDFASQDTIQSVKDKIQLGFDPADDISKFDVRRVNWDTSNPVERVLKTYTDSVFRVLSAEDTPFFNAAYARSLYDQAGADAINAGRAGDASYIKSLVDNPTSDMEAIAMKDARDATFHDKTLIGSVANDIKRRLADAGGVKGEAGKVLGELTAPFTGVPSSIATKTISYSPIGLIRGAIKAGKVFTGQVPSLQREASQEIGRGVVGTALFALGSYLMSKGLMTGQPKDSKEADQWQLEGKQTNSILLPSLDGKMKWRNINSIGPQNLMLLAGAKYMEETSGKDGSLASFFLQLGKDQLNQTFLYGMSAPMMALVDPKRNARSFLGNLESSVVPNLIKDTGKAFDPNSRETNSVSDYPKLALPFVRNKMLPKRDVLGNIIAQEPTGVGAYVDLFNSKTPITKLVGDELARLNNVGFNATPSKLGKNQTIKGVKMVLTPEQLDQLEAQTGPQLTQELEQLIKSPEYQSLSDQEKANAIDAMVAKVRKQVRGSINLDAKTTSDITKRYEASMDSPQGIIDRLALYGTGLFKDPSGTINALRTGQPIRKVRGDAVIVERMANLASLDNGDKATQVDHIIALELGGDNSESNLHVISTQDNQAKAIVDNYLASLLNSGKIKKSEAQQRDLNWRNEIQNLPKSDKAKVDAILNSTPEPASGVGDNPSTGDVISTDLGTFNIINKDTGSVTTVDLSTPIAIPTLTNLTELDKGIIAKFNSSINTRINNVEKVYLDGQITAQQANDEITALKDSLIKKGRGKGRTKQGGIRVSMPKATAVKIKFTKTKPIKYPTLKFRKLAKASLKIKPNNIRLPIKKYALGKAPTFTNTLSKGLTKLA